MDLAPLGFALLAIAGVAQIATCATAAFRVRSRQGPVALDPLPDIALVRPVCGVEPFIAEAIETSFRLSYQRLELIFCVDDSSDPIVPIVNRLIAAYPAVDARLLVGRDRISANPKLNNIVKGWNAARADWIILSDSNALLPTDYVEGLLSRWQPDIGVVSTATIVGRPEGFAAALECAFMNTYQARWVLAADSVGHGFALGKTLMWRRSVLDGLGGLPVLGREAAEDIASTKALRGTGLRPRLALRPVEQPVGRRTLRAVWQRQVRWARLRRAGLRATYWPEIASGAFLPALAGVALALSGALAWPLLGLYLAAWYAVEFVLAAVAGWPASTHTLPAALLRDLLIPVVWLKGWIGNSFEWRGNRMSVKPEPDPGSGPIAG